MRALAVAAVVALAGCGSETKQAGVEDEQSDLSARFTERTIHRLGGSSFTETMRGAFDWGARRGWAVERSAGLEERLIQIGEKCYRRFGNERWKESEANDPGGLCSVALFGNPATEDDLLRTVASDWEELGKASIHGVSTNHYRAQLNIGAVKGSIELWVDADGVVRRTRQRGEEQEDFVSVREYFDFGVGVRVRAPRLGAAG